MDSVYYHETDKLGWDCPECHSWNKTEEEQEECPECEFCNEKFKPEPY